VLDALTMIVDQGRSQAKKGRRDRSSSPPALTAEGIVGAVLSVIHARMLQDDRGPLLELLNPLMGTIVLPYLGQAAARREQERPLPQPSRPETPSRPGPRSGFSRPDGAPGPAPRDPLEGLNMRLTYRTLMVLVGIAANPGASNRQVAEAAGVHDQGQISKLLGRLEKLGLIQNTGNGQPRGEPNAWTLTPRGQEVQQVLTNGR
jgi:hypothetical protein